MAEPGRSVGDAARNPRATPPVRSGMSPIARRFTTVVAAPLALLLVAGCGGEQGEVATDTPSPSSTAGSSGSPSDDGRPTDVGDWDLAEIFTVTNGGGRPSPVAVGIVGVADVEAFSEQFRNPAIERRLTRLVTQADLMPGRALAAAVVSIGCASPTDVTVTTDGTRLLVEAVPPDSSPAECFAPMTTVALVSVPEELAPPPAAAS